MTKYGKADELILKCIEEAIQPRWAKWLKSEQAKLAKKRDAE